MRPVLPLLALTLGLMLGRAAVAEVVCTLVADLRSGHAPDDAVRGPALGITEDTVSRAAAVLTVGFGLVLLVPALGARFATATAGVSARADAGMTATGLQGLAGQFAGGALLGAVWNPCIGPTLSAAIAMASQGQDLVRAGGIMVAFALGLSTLILAIAYGARGWVLHNMGRLRAVATGRGRSSAASSW